MTLNNAWCNNVCVKRQDARKLDHKTLEAIRVRAVQRVQSGESPEVVVKRVGFFSSLHLQLAGSVSVWRLGVSQGQEALGTAAQIEGATDSVDLSDRDD